MLYVSLPASKIENILNKQDPSDLAEIVTTGSLQNTLPIPEYFNAWFDGFRMSHIQIMLYSWYKLGVLVKPFIAVLMLYSSQVKC